MDGSTLVMDRLITSSIHSRAKHSIVIESSNNLSLSTRNPNGRIENLILLGNLFFYFTTNVSGNRIFREW